MKKIKFKAFCLGIFCTLLLEVLMFVYMTCNIQVTTKYLYNPDAVVQILGDYAETTK